MKKFNVLSKIILLFIGLYGASFCTYSTKPKEPNQLPNTTLANIPIDGDTIRAYATLYWDGEDADGYVTAYKYRYITRHLIRGDSVVSDWVKTTATSQTIAFESSDDLNFQYFEVKAIDNDGDEDPTPAVKKFYTVKAYSPETTIDSPTENQELFILPQTSDWWQGIKVSFSSSDRDGEVVAYGYRVDNAEEWQWTEDTTVVLTPNIFSRPLSGIHTIEAVAKDNTGIIDPTPAKIHIRLIEPTFDRNILMIDETKEGDQTPGYTSDAQVDSFYNELFHPDTSIDYFSGGLPSKKILGHYRLLIWHSDYNFDRHYIGNEKKYIIEYLQAGGKLLLSGWRIIKSFDLEASFPQFYDSKSFLSEYLHVVAANESPSVDGAFAWARGRNGYPDIHLNPNIATLNGFPYFGGLTNVNIITPGAFTRVIYRFQCKETTNPNVRSVFQDRPCAIRYLGSSFDIILFGFPILYIQPDEAKLMAKKLLQDLLGK